MKISTRELIEKRDGCGKFWSFYDKYQPKNLRQLCSNKMDELWHRHRGWRGQPLAWHLAWMGFNEPPYEVKVALANRNSNPETRYKVLRAYMKSVGIVGLDPFRKR